MMPWHVVTMDAYIAGPFRTKREAVQACRREVLDSRKRPIVKRWRPGFYEFYGPFDFNADTGRTRAEFWIVSTKSAKRNGLIDIDKIAAEHQERNR